MNSDIFLNGIRLSLRQGNYQQIGMHLTRILKKSADPTSLPRFKTEINLEAVKALRALDRHNEAVQLCDTSIANIPADSFDLLSALKRLRSLLYLDAGDLSSARSLIEETDGLELVLQGNQSVVNRTDSDVTVETWLVSTEIALAQVEVDAAQNFFDKAVNRLSTEEAELRRKRVSFFDKRKLEQYYHDLSQILNLYALTLRIIAGDGEARTDLRDLCETVAQENEIAVGQKKLPNVPLHSKLLCLLGEWDESNRPPSGIPYSEAVRWSRFGSPSKFTDSFALVCESQPAESNGASASSSALTSLPTSENHNGEVFPVPANTNDVALTILATAVERMSGVFNRVEGVLPQFENYLRGDKNVDFTQRGFGGHLLDTDLFTLLNNAKKLSFTGIIKLAWSPDLFNAPLIKGVLPEVLRSGEATLYAVEGFITDCVFKGQNNINTQETAQDNFLLIVRMCFSIQTDEVRPDILANAIPEPAVAERPRLLRIRENDLVFITADLDEAAAGIEKEDGEAGFFETQAALEAQDASETEFDPVVESTRTDDENLFSSSPLDEESPSAQGEKPRSFEQTAFENEDSLLEI